MNGKKAKALRKAQGSDRSAEALIKDVRFGQTLLRKRELEVEKVELRAEGKFNSPAKRLASQLNYLKIRR